MAGRMSRNKGARGEREVIAILQPIVDSVCEETGQPRFELRRNPTQRFKGKEYDVIGLPWIALEVKRQENLSGLGSWWKQTLDATRPGQTPVLVYRKNHSPWKVRMKVPVDIENRLNVMCVVDVDWDTFLFWFRQRLKIALQ